MEESKDAGGGSFYDRVYAAERPEIFFKATPQRVANPGQAMHLRGDSKWMVPEPELTLAINASGEIIGCTVGNDLSCRDIEGENPLYLPQAKCFKLCAALGPAVLIQSEPLAPTARIHLQIDRAGAAAFEGETTLAQLKRTPAVLAGFLFRDNTFPTGTFLMTGTGIVPGDEFTLQSGDVVKITHTLPGWTGATFRVTKIELKSDDEVTIDTGEGGKLRIVRSMIVDVKNKPDQAQDCARVGSSGSTAKG
jgi:2-dehydro-3-deoxy-D-arabinonate dehydratase